MGLVEVPAPQADLTTHSRWREHHRVNFDVAEAAPRHGDAERLVGQFLGSWATSLSDSVGTSWNKGEFARRHTVKLDAEALDPDAMFVENLLGALLVNQAEHDEGVRHGLQLA